jgi:hypothetical protein
MPVRITAAVHIFMSVLIVGSMWRIVSYHLMASQGGTLMHVGAAMANQY